MTMEQAAAELRRELDIPSVGASSEGPRGSRPFHDGWWVTRSGARWIGLIRQVDRDAAGRTVGGILLAQEVLDHVLSDQAGASTHHSRSFLAMTAAGHHAEDPALVIALACREAGAGLIFSRSSTPHDSYSRGGADNLWHVRDRLNLPRDVRRRLRQAPPRPNERGRTAYPAMVQGRDQMIVYAALVQRAARMLEVQIKNVFEIGDLQMQTRLLSTSRHARRAWTQLSFGRGGGGGLVRALRRARELGGSLQTIFSDDQMLESDSVKRARVTAGDAALIEQFVLPLLARPTRTPAHVADRGPA